MQRFSFARFSLSLVAFLVLATGGVAVGWIQQDNGQAGRGKEVVVLALEPEIQPGEIILGALENPPSAPDIPGLPALSPDLPDRPYNSVLESASPPPPAAPAHDAAAPESAPPGTELVITLPGSGKSVSSRISPRSTSIPAIVPVALPGMGPILALPPVPVAALTENGRYGALPRMGASGEAPRSLYARPFVNLGNKPVVAVVIGGIGINLTYSADALNRLPGQITFAYSPYVPGLKGWVAAGRRGGHEALLELPMEPFGYPDTNPGERALLTSLGIEENRDNLLWHMSRMPGYIGITNHLGSKFATDQGLLRIILREVANRGLIFVESPSRRSKIAEVAAQISLPYSRARIIDLRPDQTAIRRRLDELVDKAKADGQAVGIGIAHPATIEAVIEWAQTLDNQGVILAPVSAVTQ